MIKVNFDPITEKVIGYYPDDVQYQSIPSPYIEITEQEHQEALGKTMCVKNGKLEEEIASSGDVLEQLRNEKINQCKKYLSSTDWQIIRLTDPSSGEILKESVANKRALARSLQVKLKACKTTEEINAINVKF